MLCLSVTECVDGMKDTKEDASLECAGSKCLIGISCGCKVGLPDAFASYSTNSPRTQWTNGYHDFVLGSFPENKWWRILICQVLLMSRSLSKVVYVLLIHIYGFILILICCNQSQASSPIVHTLTLRHTMKLIFPIPCSHYYPIWLLHASTFTLLFLSPFPALKHVLPNLRTCMFSKSNTNAQSGQTLTDHKRI